MPELEVPMWLEKRCRRAKSGTDRFLVLLSTDCQSVMALNDLNEEECKSRETVAMVTLREDPVSHRQRRLEFGNFEI
jgi:hypothetical protein